MDYRHTPWEEGFENFSKSVLPVCSTRIPVVLILSCLAQPFSR